MVKCKCGFEASAGKFGSHAKNCNEYKEEKVKLENINENFIVDLYKQNYSVTECCNILKKDYNIGTPVMRRIITPILKKHNVYESVNGRNTQAKKQEKIQATMLKKYGVINAGQLETNGYKAANKIPYKSPMFFDKYKKYRDNVVDRTKKNLRHIDKPKYCVYTGVRFADEICDKVNPNDPCKRSIDHIKSIYECFLTGIDIDEAAGIENVVFCLKICNTIKGNTEAQYFKKNIAKYLREEFINEGYEYKKNFKA